MPSHDTYGRYLIGVSNSIVSPAVGKPHKCGYCGRSYKHSKRISYSHHWGFLPRCLSGKESSCQCKRCSRCGFYPWVTKIPWRRKWQPTPAFLPRKFHGQRSLAGHSLWCHKKLDMTEHTHRHSNYYSTSLVVLQSSVKYLSV